MNNSLQAVSSGQGKDVILLHGLFGQGSNLRGIARALEPHFRVHCLDLPDHGRSPWLSSASLEAYSDEVLKWMNGRQICKSHMIGHSLGGKVAMQLALSDAERLKRLVVADIAPVLYPAQHAEILAVMAQVQASGCKTRSSVEEILAEVIPEPEVRGYLMMGVRQGPGGYQWRFNLAGLTSGYDQLRAAPDGEVPCETPTLFRNISAPTTYPKSLVDFCKVGFIPCQMRGIGCISISQGQCKTPSSCICSPKRCEIKRKPHQKCPQFMWITLWIICLPCPLRQRARQSWQIGQILTNCY